MANLYSIQLEYLRVMEMLEETDGEITEEIDVLLKSLYEDKDNFINALCETIINEEADVVTIKMEMERLKGRMESANKRIESIKKDIIKVLKHFDMKSANKKSKGYAFKTALFSGFTRTSESVELDEFMVSNEFRPIHGKESKYVKYSVGTKFDFETLKKINDLSIVPYGEYNVVVDKTALKEYLKDIAVGKQLTFNEDNTEVVKDPITELASLVSKESLVIK